MKIPHIAQYQGSKRLLAPQILSFFPAKVERLIEPFSGTASISIAAAAEQRTDQFLINDLNAPLIDMLQEAVEYPDRLIRDYTAVWKEQFTFGESHIQHFYQVRERFNCGDRSPANMLYLLARCVKGAVRYSEKGGFNQSPDKRRHGTNPDTAAANIYAISDLLKGKAKFLKRDYREILDMAKPGDLIYMDPPYQGVTKSRDCRYISGVSFTEFSDAVRILNRKRIDYLISYDGRRGEISYGQELPSSLRCAKVLLNAGLSAQSLLLGKKMQTLEALYISETLTSDSVSNINNNIQSPGESI